MCAKQQEKHVKQVKKQTDTHTGQLPQPSHMHNKYKYASTVIIVSPLPRTTLCHSTHQKISDVHLRLHCSASIATHQIAEWGTCANQLTPRVLHLGALVIIMSASTLPFWCGGTDYCDSYYIYIEDNDGKTDD